MLKTNLLERQKYRNVFQRAGDDRSFIKQLKRRTQLFEHIVGHDSLTKRICRRNYRG